MKYFVIFSSIILSEVIHTIGDKHKLTAVSGFEVAQTLYRKVGSRDGVQEPEPLLNEDTKSRICHHITGSAYFSGVLREKQVYLHLVYEKLIYEYPDIYLKLYKLSNRDMIYTNPSKPVDVSTGGEMEEIYRDNAFYCLSGNIHFDTSEEESEEDIEPKLQLYLISREYNVSEVGPMAGRFIFICDGADPTYAALFAVAEEPATNLFDRGAAVEHYYLYKRGEHEPEKEEFNDPICSLNKNARMRVCTLVLSSAYFESELKYIPDYKYVDETICHNMNISFQDEAVKSVTAGRDYKEWMIRCIPEERYANFQSEYYVSRVYDSDSEVFLYRWEEGRKLVIENMFGNVRLKL